MNSEEPLLCDAFLQCLPKGEDSQSAVAPNRTSAMTATVRLVMERISRSDKQELQRLQLTRQSGRVRPPEPQPIISFCTAASPCEGFQAAMTKPEAAGPASGSFSVWEQFGAFMCTYLDR